MDITVIIALIVVAATAILVYLKVLAPSKDNGSAAVAADEDEGVDEYAPPPDNAQLEKIPKLSVRAGPRDGEKWQERVKQELNALMKYIAINKASDSDWYQHVTHRRSKKTSLGFS